MKITLRLGAAIAAGCVAAVAIAWAATFVARYQWPEYAAAEPNKTYTLIMLVTRLAVGAICTATAAYLTTIIARDNGRSACWLGGLLLAVSLPIHIYREWADYPAWYHFLYLCYLVPIATLVGKSVHIRPRTMVCCSRPSLRS